MSTQDNSMVREAKHRVAAAQWAIMAHQRREHIRWHNPTGEDRRWWQAAAARCDAKARIHEAQADMASAAHSY